MSTAVIYVFYLRRISLQDFGTSVFMPPSGSHEKNGSSSVHSNFDRRLGMSTGVIALFFRCYANNFNPEFGQISKTPRRCEPGSPSSWGIISSSSSWNHSAAISKFRCMSAVLWKSTMIIKIRWEHLGIDDHWQASQLRRVCVYNRCHCQTSWL